MAHDSKIRTIEKSKKLKEDYEEDLQDLEEKIDETLAENEKALSAIRQDQLTRLLTLVQKRSLIETAIADSHTKLQQSYDTASKELRRSIKFRADLIKDTVAAATADSGEQQDAHSSGEDKENEAPPVAKAVKGLKSRSSGNKPAGQDTMEGIRT